MVNIYKTEVLYQPNSTRTWEEDILRLMDTSWTLFWNVPTSKALYRRNTKEDGQRQISFGRLRQRQTTGEKLHAFMVRHLRSIMRITWTHKVTNKGKLERTVLPYMEDLLIRKNLRWTGQLMRMSPDRLLMQILYSLLVTEREGALVSGSRIPNSRDSAANQELYLCDILEFHSLTLLYLLLLTRNGKTNVAF